MEENCVILGLNENEVELELALSIGGSFKRIEKLKPFKKDQNRNRTPDSGVSEKPQPLAAAEQECAAAAADPQRKREIQAMRRQEAKKKREEKQQKRGLSCRGQKNRCRSRDSVEQPECKKIKVEFSGSSDGETKSANLNSGGAPNAGHNVDPNSAFCSLIPVQVPCPYPYPQVQYGFGNYPCGTTGTLQCWSGVSGGNDPNAGQQAANQGFRPFMGSHNSGSGFDSDPNSSCNRDERNRKSGSNGSAVCSSPLLSDLQSSSNQGGSSNVIGPNCSNGCQPDHPAPTTGPKCQLEETETSHQTDYSTPSTNDSSTKPNDHHHTEAVSADNSNSKEEPAAPVHKKPLIVKDDSNIVDSENKPPPPSSLPYMPCVSTTGDGPNGRTVNGFLYRYSQTEVSIVCVCHGSSFSPAEFVKHAGGTGVLQPLRHITVIPSAF